MGSKSVTLLETRFFKIDAARGDGASGSAGPTAKCNETFSIKTAPIGLTFLGPLGYNDKSRNSFRGQFQLLEATFILG